MYLYQNSYSVYNMGCYTRNSRDDILRMQMDTGNTTITSHHEDNGEKSLSLMTISGAIFIVVNYL